MTPQLPLLSPTHNTEPIKVTIPIHTVNELNAHEFWRERHKRAKRQHAAVAMLINPRCAALPALPVIVKLTRVAPRLMDEGDGLPASMKFVRDAVAKLYGVGDSPRDPIKWEYAQRKSKEYAVEIHIRPDAKEFT